MGDREFDDGLAAVGALREPGGADRGEAADEEVPVGSGDREPPLGGAEGAE